MKSIIAVALLALVSTAAQAGKTFQVPHPPPAAASNPTPDPDLSDADIRDQARAYLGSIDTPITAERWKALGPRAEAILLEVVQGEELPTRRAKAIDGLAAVGTSRIGLLKSIAGNEQELFVVRYAAVRGLGALLPEKQMISELVPVMKGAKDLRVRAAAGSVLARRAPKATCALVRKQIARESKDDRDQFGRALDACFDQR